MKSMKKKSSFGNIDIPDEAFKPENVKLKVTTYLDLDIVQKLKIEAAQSGTKYQTLMNQKLREVVIGVKIDHTLQEKIREIVQEELKKRNA